MRTRYLADCYVIARENNVVRVDFNREPDPPAPQFPGAAALRNRNASVDSVWPDAGSIVSLQRRPPFQLEGMIMLRS
jgi:hypothetical protein